MNESFLENVLGFQKHLECFLAGSILNVFSNFTCIFTKIDPGREEADTDMVGSRGKYI